MANDFCFHVIDLSLLHFVNVQTKIPVGGFLVPESFTVMFQSDLLKIAMNFFEACCKFCGRPVFSLFFQAVKSMKVSGMDGY